MKVLVTGAHGQLGSDVVARLTARGFETIGAGKEDFDITDKKAVVRFFEKEKPGAVPNSKSGLFLMNFQCRRKPPAPESYSSGASAYSSALS